MKAAKEQTNFKVFSIPAEIAREVRLAGKSPQYGHPASSGIATGYGPCRSCLKTFETGKDERVLFTYNPFAGRAGLPLPGPVFIHKSECERYDAEFFPPGLRNLPMVFEAFAADGEMLKRVKVAEENIEALIDELFALPAADYIYVRNAEAGCFMAIIERKKSVD
jgi:hypothetical protein